MTEQNASRPAGFHAFYLLAGARIRRPFPLHPSPFDFQLPAS
ncbi:hypothetical protein [Burkholderia sp. Bp8991]|nr:hypothetical protein [Burkholderia sp. Bp8991]